MITAERLRQRIADLVLSQGTVRFGVTASFGVVTLMPDRNMNLEQILQQVDEAMYQAKRNGRNRVEVAK